MSNLLDLTDGGVVGKQEALEALVCRESVLLLQAFAERENERHGRLPQGNDTLSCMAVSDETGQLDLQEAFLKSLVSGEHFVDTILVSWVSCFFKKKNSISTFSAALLQS